MLPLSSSLVTRDIKNRERGKTASIRVVNFNGFFVNHWIAEDISLRCACAAYNVGVQKGHYRNGEIYD